ncbi:MAG: hypothetical protein WB609_07310 [Candidatus Cybelea sp.]
MVRFNSSGSPRWGFLISALAIALLAGCAGQSSLTPPPATLGAADTLQRLGTNVPDFTPPPKCKGQKITKQYAEVAKEAMKMSGGSLCVPAFSGWGGALQYPKTYSSYAYNVKLISSTKAYPGGSFPPAGSQKPIFYLQIAFNSFPGFFPTLPKGNPLVSSHLTPKKSYTIGLYEYFYGLGWSEEASCYQVAAKSKYGGALASLGAVFERQTFREKTGAIEIFAGALVTNKC